jgi:SAM-dependent methyltransferase
MNVTRFSRSAVSRAEAATVVAGLRPYRRRYDVSAPKWDREYAAGALDHYGDIRQRSRYAVLAGYLEDRQPESILDLGCGVGLLRGYLEHIEFERYVGIDPSAVAIEEATARGFSRSSFEVGTQPEPGFDAIVCNEVLYYVEDLDGLLSRIAECLNDGGRLITSVYKHPGDFAIHHRVNRVFEPVDTVDVRSTLSRHRWRLATYAVR